jgi:hypothetical protein
MVDLLGHASHLQRAEGLINIMSGELNAGVWMVLLGASRIHGIWSWGSALQNEFWKWTLEDMLGLCVAIKHLCWCWPVGSQCSCSRKEK